MLAAEPYDPHSSQLKNQIGKKKKKDRQWTRRENKLVYYFNFDEKMVPTYKLQKGKKI